MVKMPEVMDMIEMVEMIEMINDDGDDRDDSVDRHDRDDGHDIDDNDNRDDRDDASPVTLFTPSLIPINNRAAIVGRAFTNFTKVFPSCTLNISGGSMTHRRTQKRTRLTLSIITTIDFETEQA